MKIVTSTAATLMLFAAPVAAADWGKVETEVPATASQSAFPASPESLKLAEKFVLLLYPSFADTDALISEYRETLGSFFTSDSENASIDSKTDAKLKRDVEKELSAIDRKLREQAPKFLASYSLSFAHQYSEDELRELIAFGSSPVGRRFLDHSRDLASATEVSEVSEDFLASIAPEVHNLQRIACERSTTIRVAQGDKAAKCSMG